MSAVGFVRKALAMGVDLETALKMGEAFEAEMPVFVPSDAAAEKRRAYDRDRKRAKRSTGIPPESVESAASTGTPQKAAPAKDAPAPVHTHVVDNLSRLEIYNNLTTPNDASDAHPDLDWPEGDKPSKAYLDQLEAALLDAVGPALASPAIAPKVKVLGPILALGRRGGGPPCDMQADVLPTIRARSARAPPGSIKSWEFFTEAIREARDRRLTGAPAIEPTRQGPRHERPDQPSAKRTAREDNLARAFAGASAALGSREVA